MHGSKSYKTELNIAPINDDILLGLNLNVTYNITVDMGQSKFITDGNELQLKSGESAIISVVATVSVPKRIVLQPNTIVHVNDQLDVQLKCFIVEKCDPDVPILVYRCYYQDQGQPGLCLANNSDRPFKIGKTQLLPQPRK